MLDLQLGQPVLNVGLLLLDLLQVTRIHGLPCQHSIECLSFEDGRALALHVVWQFYDVLTSLDRLISHH